MTFKQRYEKESKWDNKVTIIEIYHFTRQYKNKEWKVLDTAKYFGISVGLASENLKLARNLDKVGNCKSRKQALQALKELRNGN